MGPVAGEERRPWYAARRPGGAVALYLRGNADPQLAYRRVTEKMKAGADLAEAFAGIDFDFAEYAVEGRSPEEIRLRACAEGAPPGWEEALAEAVEKDLFSLPPPRGGFALEGFLE